MYTFCSFLQVLIIYCFKLLSDSLPVSAKSLNFVTIKSRFASELLILESSRKDLDWITSSVVLVLPESYSKVIPSFAISAAFTCEDVDNRTLFAEIYSDHAFVVEVLTLSFLSSNRSLFLDFICLAFFISEKFLPPLISGHLIVAFKVSLSTSSMDELKSLLSDFVKLSEADGESLAFSIS